MYSARHLHCKNGVRIPHKTSRLFDNRNASGSSLASYLCQSFMAFSPCDSLSPINQAEERTGRHNKNISKDRSTDRELRKADSTMAKITSKELMRIFQQQNNKVMRWLRFATFIKTLLAFSFWKLTWGTSMTNNVKK